MLYPVHFGQSCLFVRSCPLWRIRSILADQVQFGGSGPLFPTKSTLADQVHFGRSGPLWPIRSTLADQVHFGRSSPLGSGRLGRPISRPVLVMQDCPIGSTLHQVYFSIQVRLTMCMDMHRQTLVYIYIDDPIFNKKFSRRSSWIAARVQGYKPG